MRARLLTTGAAAAVIAALVVAFLIFRDRTPDIAVATAQVTSGTVSRQVLAIATVEPVRTVDVGSQVSGTISALPVDFNSVVKVGQVVAEIDPRLYKSQLDAARAALAQTKADAAQIATTLTDAETKYKRAQQLDAQQLVTQADLDATRVAVDQARAELRARQATIAAAEATLKRAEIDLAHTVIRSPIDGIVVNRAVDEGQTVAATLQSPVLLTIADLRKMQLLVEINEGEVGGVQAGSPVSFQVESLGNRTFVANVATVRLQPYATSTTTGTTGAMSTAGRSSASATPTATTGTATTASASITASSTSGAATAAAAPGAVTYTAVIEVDNSDGRLTPGSTAVVTVSGGERTNATRIPNAALAFLPPIEALEKTGQEGLATSTGPNRRDRGAAQVWRYENGKFVPVDVKVGLSDDRWTEVVSGGVKAGDALVTAVGKRD